MPDYQLAHFNIARVRAPEEPARLSDFVNNLDPIFELAEDSPGFVWRSQTDDDDAQYLRNISAGATSV